MSHGPTLPNTPTPGVRSFSAAELSALCAKAAAVERLRANLNVHASVDAKVQRLFIATEPGTYMRPHRHPEPHKWEFFVVLRGRLDLLIFADDGELRTRVALSPGTVPATEIAPGVFHAYVCMESGSLALEVKEGAYIPTPEHDFAPWAPPERTAEAAAYLDWMRSAQPGSRAQRPTVSSR